MLHGMKKRFPRCAQLSPPLLHSADSNPPQQVCSCSSSYVSFFSSEADEVELEQLRSQGRQSRVFSVPSFRAFRESLREQLPVDFGVCFLQS